MCCKTIFKLKKKLKSVKEGKKETPVLSRSKPDPIRSSGKSSLPVKDVDLHLESHGWASIRWGITITVYFQLWLFIGSLE